MEAILNFFRVIFSLKQNDAVPKNRQTSTRSGPLSPKETSIALDILFNNRFCLRDFLKSKKKECRPVQCRVMFSGCGYVEGRTEHFVLSRRVSLTEADDDMEFTDYCILIDMVPVLILSCDVRDKHGISVKFISPDKTDLDLMLRDPWFPIRTFEQYEKLPSPVRTTLEPLLRTLLELHAIDMANHPVEKMLDLEFNK